MADVKVKIGGIVLGIESRLENLEELVPANYLPFLTDEPADCIFEFKIDQTPGLDTWELLFDTHGVWRLHHTRDAWAFCFYTNLFGSDPFCTAILDKNLLQGEIIADQRYYAGKPIPFALDYPVGELLFAHLLGQVGGLIVHACAVKDGERAILLAGHSGAGKSTMAGLWIENSTRTLLSDDRVILRQQDHKFLIYGTPWHGDAKVVSAENALLQEVFILKHEQQNRAQRLRPVELSSRLFARSFPIFWNKTGLERAVELLGDISQSIPGWELGFIPDRSVIEYMEPFFQAW
jgi:hypothetical protein